MDAAVFTITGDPSAIQASAADWMAFAAAAAASDAAVSAAVLVDFNGDEGDLHRTWLTGRFAPALTAADQAWTTVARALTVYATELADCRTELRTLAASASDEQRRGRRARTELFASQRADGQAAAATADAVTTSPAPVYISQTAGLQQRAAESQQMLADMHRRAAAVRERHELAVTTCCVAIQAATALAPTPEPALTSGVSTASSPGARLMMPVRTGNPTNQLQNVSRRLAVASGTSALYTSFAAGLFGGHERWVAVTWSTMLAGTRSPRTGAGAITASWKNNSPNVKYQGPDSSRPWRDYTLRHNAAKTAAVLQIRSQVAAMGGDPDAVSVEYDVPVGSKNGTGNPGKADIVWNDVKHGTTYVWEVKGSSTPATSFKQRIDSETATAEARGYADKLSAGTGLTVQLGFPLSHPVATPYKPVSSADWELLMISNGATPGAIVYTPQRLKNRPKAPPELVPDPVVVPEPVPQPVPPKLVPAEPVLPPFLLVPPVLGPEAAAGGLAVLGVGFLLLLGLAGS